MYIALLSLAASALQPVMAASEIGTSAQNVTANSSADEKAAEVTEATSTRVEETVKVTDRKHPDFVRCKSVGVLGSRVKRERVCHTNAEWEAIARKGSRTAGDIVNQPRIGGGVN